MTTPAGSFLRMRTPVVSRILVRAVRSRQAVFFLIAIVLPGALLVLLTARMLVQERELEDKRFADERRRIAADIRQGLLARVESIRFDVIHGDRASESLPRELVMTAFLDAGRLVLPWERDAATAIAIAATKEPRFYEAVQRGEREEFMDGRFAEAASAYRAAVAHARLPVHKNAAQMLFARALAKAGQKVSANRVYRSVLQGDPAVVDDEGIPFVLYAARQLLDPATPENATLDVIASAIEGALGSPLLRPVAMYMARDLLRDLEESASAVLRPRIADLSAKIAHRINDVEQLVELQKTFPAIAMPPRSDRSSDSAVWVPFGPATNPWLVNARDDAQPPFVVVVRAEPLLRATVAVSPFAAAGVNDVALSRDGDGEPLSPDFPGLAVIIAPAAVTAVTGERGLQRPVYVAALAVVLSAALFGAYLFWRDVQREVRLADLRTQFVSSVSHELKTPLTAIRMFAETLQLGRSVRPEVSQEYLDTIVNESERLTRLLNNVLDFSKIEQGTKTYRLVPQSPATLVRTAVKATQYLLAQQGFALHLRVADDLPPIAADADAIQQAILNLLSNAMKYSGDGRAIDVELSRDDECVVIGVTDRGIGIPASEQQRIFEKFYRVQSRDHQHVPGTGLGLTLVNHVARAHGGSVTVRSAPGEGSTFSLRLPLKRDDIDAVADASVPARI